VIPLSKLMTMVVAKMAIMLGIKNILSFQSNSMHVVDLFFYPKQGKNNKC
jgi:hypothetical protein